MKAFRILLPISIMIFSSISRAQIQTTDSISIKTDNFMDMGTKTLTQIFGNELDGNSTNEPIGYLELLKKSNVSPEQKAEYKNLYYLQAKALTKKQKDSLGAVLQKKILEAKKEGN